MTLLEIDTFTRAYIECALWSSCIEPFGRCPECGRDDCVLCRWNGAREHVCAICSERQPSYEPPADDNYDVYDIAPKTLAKMIDECAAFHSKHWNSISPDISRAGHDFWLTRNHHGAGFWDGDWPEDEARILTAESQAYGEFNLYVGEDGKLHDH
jgi:hypothetical protein